MIWLNPPYSMNVQANIGREVLNLVSKHFPKNHQYNKIFNKNSKKVSDSCTDNLQAIIKKHNRKILETSKTSPTENNCNCGRKKTLPTKKQLPHLKRRLLHRGQTSEHAREIARGSHRSIKKYKSFI